MRLNLLLKLCFLLVVYSLCSCADMHNSVYFSKALKSEYQGSLDNLEPIIQKNDLLSITVNSLNPAATQIFNAFQTNTIRSTDASNTLAPVTGYLVDQDGYIQFPILGRIKAAGISKKDLKENIEQSLANQKLLKDPIVDIRYLNYKVSVLGEVAKPAVLTIPSEKITLLEALGLAGDLTIYASRNNVLLIRDEGGKKKLTRIDLTSDELFTSPYYNLKSNDIIYVEPNKAKISSASTARQWLPLVLSGLTLVVVSIDRLGN